MTDIRTIILRLSAAEYSDVVARLRPADGESMASALRRYLGLPVRKAGGWRGGRKRKKGGKSDGHETG
jgi:hypothetical protein